MLSRLRAHSEKLVNCSIVASVLESKQFRTTLLEVRASAFGLFALCIYQVLQVPPSFRATEFYDARERDDEEICDLLQDLLESKDEKRAARSLRGEDAKSFMEVLKQARVHLGLVINTTQGWNYRH